MKKIANIFIVDASSSMIGEKITSAVSGLNEALMNIKEGQEGVDNYTEVWQFSSPGQEVCLTKQVSSSKLEPVEIMASGNTCLYDCIKLVMNNLPEGFDGGIVNIYTDGQENMSRTTLSEVQNILRTFREKKWLITFTGADEESLRQAEAMGISRGNTIHYKSAKGLELSAKRSRRMAAQYATMDLVNASQKSFSQMAEEHIGDVEEDK